MQSDPGAGVPHTGGNDDAVWRDLVARLQEPDDDFMNEPGPERTGDGGAVNGHDAGSVNGHDGTDSLDAVESSEADERKTVTDFDPLGVWQRQSEPASREPDMREPALPGHSKDPAAGPRDYFAEDDDGEFVPEELPSLSLADPAVMASWIGAAGGPLFLVFSAIFWRQIPLLVVFAVILAFLAGTGYLLFRLPSDRDHDSGDGAVL